jgi:hypothetical protein
MEVSGQLYAPVEEKNPSPRQESNPDHPIFQPG